MFGKIAIISATISGNGCISLRRSQNTKRQEQINKVSEMDCKYFLSEKVRFWKSFQKQKEQSLNKELRRQGKII